MADGPDRLLNIKFRNSGATPVIGAGNTDKYGCSGVTRTNQRYRPAGSLRVIAEVPCGIADVF